MIKGDIIKRAVMSLGDYNVVIINPSSIETNDDFDNNVKWVTGEDKDGTAVFGERPEEITWDVVQAEIEKTQYIRDRKSDYPTWQDQLDQMYHEGIDAWKETIKAVKDAHPKPE